MICSSTPTNEGAFHFLCARTTRWQVRMGLLNCKGNGKVPSTSLWLPGKGGIPATLSEKNVTLILPATGGNNGDMNQRVAFSARRVQEGGTPLLTATFTPRFLRADAISPSFYPFSTSWSNSTSRPVTLTRVSFSDRFNITQFCPGYSHIPQCFWQTWVAGHFIL